MTSKKAEMTEDEYVAALDKYIQNSSYARSSQLDEDVADALDYYYGKPFGNEVDGRSSVVTRDVLEAVEWALPSIIRVFASGDRFMEFDPVGSDDVDLADQETEYVNHVIIKKNNGWKMFYDWFKGAMLQKNAYIKTWVEEKENIEVVSHSGMTEQQLLEIRNTPDMEIIELEEYIEETLGIPLYDVEVEIRSRKKEIKAACIPPEEMRIWDDWDQLSLDGCPFVCHEREVPMSDLVAMGLDEDEVKMASSNEESDISRNKTESARHQYDQEDLSETEDDSQDRILVSECYVLIDGDGDGISEQRKILKIGQKIFENEVIDEQPFATISPLPMPHNHIGMSYGELVMDIQKIRSTLTRQILDNLYLSNNPEKEVVTDLVNMEDLLVSVPGGIKRVMAPNSIRELTVPFTAGQSLPMLTILDQMKETRIGVSRGSMGLDADVLAKTTRGAFFGAMESASQRIEMVSRVFAETGVKELFLKVHKLAITHMDKAEVIRLRGNYVHVNPSEWRNRTNLTAVVGLGSGNRDQQLTQLSMVAEKQEQHLMNGSPMVELHHLYHTYSKMLNIIGFKDVTRFWHDPSSQQFQQKMMAMAQQPKEPSEIDKTLQAQKEVEMMKATQRQQESNAKMVAELDKFRRELDYKYDQLAADLRKHMTSLEIEYNVDVPGSAV